MLCLAYSGVQGQGTLKYDPKVEEYFSYAVNLFESQQYHEAAKTFQRLIRTYPSSQRVTASYIMGAKSFLLGGEPHDAISFLKPLFIRFPQSTYLGDALTILTQAYITTANYRGAARALVIASITAPHDSTRREYARILDNKVYPMLVDDDLEEIVGEFDDPRCTDFLRGGFASYLQSLGRIEDALSHIEKINPAARSAETRTLEEMLIRESGRGEDPIRIVLILPSRPVSGAARSVYDDLLHGILAALDKHNDAAGVKFELIRINYGGDDDKLRATLEYLQSQERVMGILGGLFSEDTRKIIGSATGLGIPFLAASATANGIADAGEYFFQLNPDYETRGAAMAQYAKNVLGAKRAAVVSPIDTYGKLLADGFQRRAATLDLHVEAVSWYQANDLNLASQIYSIRNSLSGTDSIDILYAPVARKEQMIEIAAQCLQQGLRCRLLGSGDWNDPEQLRRLPLQILPVDMEGDVFVDPSTREWETFSIYYGRQTGTPWSRTAVLGYDAADLLCSVIKSGRIARESVRERLLDIRDFSGARGKISFSPNRVSNTVPILRYRDGTLRKIANIRTGEQ